MTSLPIPSPGITAILYGLIGQVPFRRLAAAARCKIAADPAKRFSWPRKASEKRGGAEAPPDRILRLSIGRADAASENRSNFQSPLDAGVGRRHRAFVEAGEHRVVDLLAFDELDHDGR